MNFSKDLDLKYLESIFNINHNIEIYSNIISSSIGIPCNIISIFIFARLMRNKNNMGFLYIWQCSVDICLLLFTLILFRSGITLGIDLKDQTQYACKSLSMLRSFIFQASSWIAVLTTFDRFTFVLYGHCNRFRFLKSKRNLTCIILTIFAIIIVIDTPTLLFYNEFVFTHYVCSADFTVKLTSDIISILLRTYFPFTLMIIFNVIMIRKIVNKNKNLTQKTSFSRKESQFTLAVIAFDVFFFSLSFPISVYHVLYDINYVSGHFLNNLYFHAKYTVVSAVTGNLSLCEQTFSFFMYFFFNKLFRKELFCILGRIFRSQRLSSVDTSMRS